MLLPNVAVMFRIYLCDRVSMEYTSRSYVSLHRQRTQILLLKKKRDFDRTKIAENVETKISAREQYDQANAVTQAHTHTREGGDR